MLRAHVTSKRRSIPSKRVDYRKHEIGRVLDVKVCFHQRRYGIEIMVESLFRDNSFLGSNCERNWQLRNRNLRNHFSWKRWAQSYREKLLRKQSHDQCLLWHCLLYNFLFVYRKWIDINPESSMKIVLQCQKPWIILLRHDASIPREDDGAMRLDDFMEELKAKKFDGTSQWLINVLGNVLG